MSGSVLKILSQLQSVPFNGSVNSDSLRPYCVQHIRLHCPSPTPRACLKFKPIKMVMPSNHLILWRPLLLWPSIFPCIRVFSNEPVFASDGQSIGASALPLSMNIQDWFPLALTASISLQSKGLSRVFPNTTVQNNQFFSAQLSLWSNSPIHTWWLLGKLSFDIWTFFGKIMSLPFNTLSRWVIAFLPRSKRLSLSWQQSPSAVVLEPQKKAWDWIHCFPVYFPLSDGTRCQDLRFLNVEF